VLRLFLSPCSGENPVIVESSATLAAPGNVPQAGPSQAERRAREERTFGSLLADDSPLVQREVRRELERRGRAAVPLLEAIARRGEPRARTAARGLLLARGRERVAARMLKLALAPTVDLERGLWLLSRFEEPELDVRPYVLALDAMAAQLLERIEARSPLEPRAPLLADYLGRELGYHGDSGDYHHPDNVYLHRAITRKRGLPLTLTALYLFVARRAGIRAAPVALPGHVILRVWEPDGRSTLLDPFQGGATLGERECLRYLARHGLPFAPRWFEPASDVAIWTRHVGNLRNSYGQRGLAREVALLARLGGVLAQRSEGARP
jgi:regulator of sirC expression with transglutaminase-like and TPR domain